MRILKHQPTGQYFWYLSSPHSYNTQDITQLNHVLKGNSRYCNSRHMSLPKIFQFRLWTGQSLVILVWSICMERWDQKGDMEWPHMCHLHQWFDSSYRQGEKVSLQRHRIWEYLHVDIWHLKVDVWQEVQVMDAGKWFLAKVDQARAWFEWCLYSHREG